MSKGKTVPLVRIADAIEQIQAEEQTKNQLLLYIIADLDDILATFQTLLDEIKERGIKTRLR